MAVDFGIIFKAACNFTEAYEEFERAMLRLNNMIRYSGLNFCVPEYNGFLTEV